MIRSFLFIPLFLLLSQLDLAVAVAVALPPPPISPKLPGHYVPFHKLSTCPKLSHRKYPRSAKDVRPDDFRVVMALGDSITAGLLARGSRDDYDYDYSLSSTPSGGSQRPFRPISNRLLSIAEYRGLSYPIGYDEDAITIPRILDTYARKNLTGVSRGQHPPTTCLGTGPNPGIDLGKVFGKKGICTPRPEEDGLNAAVSGSVSGNLMAQVKDYLLPRIAEMGIRDEDWKYVNLGIGANDICSFCLTPNATGISITGSPQQFAADIREAVNVLREHVPNIIVNIIGLFRVSAIYRLTLTDPYCQPPLLPLPHLALECSCALLPGPAGDYTRGKMDELGEAYDEAVLQVIEEWEKEDDPTFGAIWQPGTVVDLANYPITALSPIDCFHPSELAHQRVAAGFWNRMTLSLEKKYLPIEWEAEVYVRCLEEDDRIPVGMVSESARRYLRG
ncbi:hypothetical protein CI109_107207 [Kwoniella shandongensis]|uniref:Uncharacterized protein n=1 Tax=Kwoniella shandongensis TaxID=1734106 RepID=A0A5M6C7G8_9TREE|nr:uncharacterized protein CI109_002490 [Kwoniella shandongensis]KAA5529149.1 hypothetical protein CI109_002490 [Kwoniella shandongensis]